MGEAVAVSTETGQDGGGAWGWLVAVISPICVLVALYSKELYAYLTAKHKNRTQAEIDLAKTAADSAIQHHRMKSDDYHALFEENRAYTSSLRSRLTELEMAQQISNNERKEAFAKILSLEIAHAQCEAKAAAQEVRIEELERRCDAQDRQSLTTNSTSSCPKEKEGAYEDPAGGRQP